MTDPLQPQPPSYTNQPFTDVPTGGASASYPPPADAYGTSASSVPPAQSGYPPPAVYPVAASSGLSENSAGALAYVTIIPAIIFLILEPYNRMAFVKFHSIQCLALAGVSFVLQIGLSMTSLFLHFIPLVGILFSLLHLAVFAVIAVAWLMALIKASQGQWYKLPVIGDFAMKQTRV